MSNIRNLNETEELAPLSFKESDMAEVQQEFPLSSSFPPIKTEGEDIEAGLDPTYFDESVYQNLPEPISASLACAKNQDDRMTLLIGDLVVLSSTMASKVFFNYQKRYRPNLLAFVVGPPASGKGRVALCPLLVEPIHKEMMERTMSAMAGYKKELTKWNKGNNGENPPERPNCRCPCARGA